MRISIGKPQHRELLLRIAVQLGSDKPSDALEHILNCWMVGNSPTASPASPTAQEPHSADEFEGLIDF
jgi:hypothetical protein